MKNGFTLIEIMIVVGIIGLLAGVAIPNFMRSRTTAQTSACITNLRQIEGAVLQWGLETRQGTNVVPQYVDISGYLKGRITCPAGGANATFDSSYLLSSGDQPPQCKIMPSTHVLPTTPN